MRLTTEKSHMSDISYKAYMGKTVICCTLAMNTIIAVLYLCMVTTCTCICTGVSKNPIFSAVYVHKESSLVRPDLFLAQGVYRLLYDYDHDCDCKSGLRLRSLYTHSITLIHKQKLISFTYNNCIKYINYET